MERHQKRLVYLGPKCFFSLGDSRRLCFWKDIWCGKVALSTTFPTLFNLTAHKDAKVVDVWDFFEVEGGRSFIDWEVERFLCLLHNRKVRPCQEDKLLMKDSKNAGFSARLVYNLLDHCSPLVFPSRFIWNLIGPPKLGFFA